jgi:hypothetical protein
MNVSAKKERGLLGFDKIANRIAAEVGALNCSVEWRIPGRAVADQYQRLQAFKGSEPHGKL